MDDIIVTRSSETEIQKFITMLDVEFSWKDIDNLHFFLGIEVNHLTNISILLKNLNTLGVS